MDAVKSLNGEMWIFASLLIAVVILQAVLFLRLALRVNKKHQYFTREEIGHFLKMGSLSVPGPAFSVVVVAISLIAMVGSGLTFMRVGVIGAASYEMMIATTAAETIGVPFGSPEFSESVLVQLLVSHVFTFLSSYAILIAVGMAVLVAYFFYRRDVRRDEEAAHAAEEA